MLFWAEKSNFHIITASCCFFKALKLSLTSLTAVNGNSENVHSNLGLVNGNLGPVNGNLGPINGNLGPVNGNVGPVNGNLGPVNGNLGALKKTANYCYYNSVQMFEPFRD